MLELHAENDGPAEGVVLEANLQKGLGVSATAASRPPYEVESRKQRQPPARHIKYKVESNGSLAPAPLTSTIQTLLPCFKLYTLYFICRRLLPHAPRDFGDYGFRWLCIVAFFILYTSYCVPHTSGGRAAWPPPDPGPSHRVV